MLQIRYFNIKHISIELNNSLILSNQIFYLQNFNLMLTKLLYRQILLLCLIMIPFLSKGQIYQSSNPENYDSFKDWFYTIEKVRFTSPDSAISLYNQAYEYYISKKHYVSAVNALVESAIVYGHQAKYQAAYDNLWKALLISDEQNNDEAKQLAYLHLGRYYNFYKRDKKALEYVQKALEIGRKLVEEDKVPKSFLASYYYALVSTYRELDMPKKGKIYLDSCYLYNNEKINGYLEFEKAYILKTEGKTEKALNLMLSTIPWFELHNPGYKALLYTFIGDFFNESNDFETAENYYQEALMFSDKFNSHLDFTPIIYQHLSDLYLNKGDYKKAAQSLQKEQELNKLFFDSRSKNNSALLEIKDDYQTEKNKQRLDRLEHQKRVKVLQTILLIVTIIFIVFAGLIYVKSVRNKHKVEKELMRKKQELEIEQQELEIQRSKELLELKIQQSKEVLELKNKELAASSLKLIEKDEILATLKKRLSEGKGDLKAAELKKIVRTISISNAQNWEEFETRFISVNHDFISNLNKRYPKLTQGDIKLCSLIKLNLSSKEMAKLLGISVQSIHTNRYRLRKKLGLEKDVSLTEFIASV